MKSVEEQLAAIRKRLEEIHEEQGFAGLPTVVTMQRAARELSVSTTTLKLMIRRRELMTVPIGKRQMVPASEIRRLASIDVKPAEKAADRRTVPSGLQDPEALKRRR